MREIPVYVITGFLESGKTSFLRDVLESEDFADGQKGLLILCEEGIEEYDEADLASKNIDVISVEQPEEFHKEFLEQCAKHYRPRRIFVEMNGVWDPKWLLEEELPRPLEIAQVITIVDGICFWIQRW